MYCWVLSWHLKKRRKSSRAEMCCFEALLRLFVFFLDKIFPYRLVSLVACHLGFFTSLVKCLKRLLPSRYSLFYEKKVIKLSFSWIQYGRRRDADVVLPRYRECYYCVIAKQGRGGEILSDQTILREPNTVLWSLTKKNMVGKEEKR